MEPLPLLVHSLILKFVIVRVRSSGFLSHFRERLFGIRPSLWSICALSFFFDNVCKALNKDFICRLIKVDSAAKVPTIVLDNCNKTNILVYIDNSSDENIFALGGKLSVFMSPKKVFEYLINDENKISYFIQAIHWKEIEDGWCSLL